MDAIYANKRRSRGFKMVDRGEGEAIQKGCEPGEGGEFAGLGV